MTAEKEKTFFIRDRSNLAESIPSKPFDQLSVAEVEEWLVRLGLEKYTSELKRWRATGSKLLDASNSQIEKELDIKNVLHRKKLLYAIESERCKGVGYSGSEKVSFSKFSYID